MFSATAEAAGGICIRSRHAKHKEMPPMFNHNKSKMEKRLIAAGALACMLGTGVQAQTKGAEAPKGEAIVQVFTNFHSGFGKENDKRGFDLERSYLGYKYDLGNGLSVKGVMDIGQSNDVNDYQRIAYIKNAMLTWKTGKWTVNGGLISTTQFNLAEKLWGFRYVQKSFQDQYKFGSSADLGVSAAWKANEWLSADAIVVNGEGYKKVQVEDGLLYGVGATLTPVKGLNVRLYASINEQPADGKKDVMNYSAFAGYKADAFSLGAEYDVMTNTSGADGHDQYGFSVYGSVKVDKNAEVFARFDDLSSKDDWNKKKDESALLVGAQWKLGKYVKIAPNFRMAMPKADGADNKYSGYVSCYFGL